MLEVGRQARGMLVEARPRNAAPRRLRPQAFDAGAEIRPPPQRMASRVISGCPDAPGSPLHSPGRGRRRPAGAGGSVPVVRLCRAEQRAQIELRRMPARSSRQPRPASTAVPGAGLASAMERIGILLSSPGKPLKAAHGPLGPDKVSDILTTPFSPSAHPGQNPDRDTMQPIRKAVFPVAGLGTRFLPATKAMPKEMLPVVDRPVIQHVVDEAREAGIEHFIFVTGRNKGAIEDHFDKQFELEATLAAARQEPRARAARSGAAAAPARPASPASRSRSGSAMRCGARARSSATSRSRCCCPTCCTTASRGCLAEMMDSMRATAGGNVIAVYEVPLDQVQQYGIVGVGETIGKGFRITSMVEKPKPADAPSRYMISGRYILQPEIFALLEQQTPGAGGEIQVTDAMLTLAEQQPFYRLSVRGTHLRQRLEDRLPHRQRRLRARARRHCAGVPRRAAAADRKDVKREFVTAASASRPARWWRCSRCRAGWT